MSRILIGTICALIALATSAARAETVLLQFDLNSITIQAKDASGNSVSFDDFNVNHTGTLEFGLDDDSTLAVGVGGNWNVGFSATLHDLVGQIQLLNGVVAGGEMSVTVLNADSTFDTYAFQLVPDSGSVTRPVSNISFLLQGYQLLADSSGGALTDANYGGVNVAPWYEQQPLLGTLMQIRFYPDSNGFDNKANVDLTAIAVVPLPPTAYAGAVLLAGLFAWRLRTARRIAIEG